ncbi:hypothetical protein TNCV_3019701 [Trichonephila clavipes]|nr:hypothetical protein TNCV_3019701 [Trichonephila clavipes]
MFGTLSYDSPLPNQVKLNYPPIQQARQIAVNRTIKHHKINKQRRTQPPGQPIGVTVHCTLHLIREQPLSSQPSQKTLKTHHPDEEHKPRLPDSIAQPITNMPLSRMENTTFAMPSIIDSHDMGLRTVYSPNAQKKTPIQPIQRRRRTRTRKGLAGVSSLRCCLLYHPVARQRAAMTATAGSDVVRSGRPIFDDFFQHLWPYIGNNTANVVFQMVKRLWLIRIYQ